MSTDGYLDVAVTWDSDLVSSCLKVQVIAADGGLAESAPLTLAGHSELDVGVYQDGRGTEVRALAIGLGADCATPTVPAERSDVWSGAFVSRVVTPVPLHVSREHQDGGQPDGGASDGGSSDGGTDADGDGSPAGVDCDDSNPARTPGKPELCDDGLDNDCNQLVDCADPSCNGKSCAHQGLCASGQCAGATSEICTDGVDNDGDGLIDCADPDCAGLACSDGDACTLGEVCTSGHCGGGTPKDCGAGLAACFLNTGCDAGVCLAAPIAAGSGTCSDGLSCTSDDSCDGDGGCVGTPIDCTPSGSPCFSPTCREDGGCGYILNLHAACDDGQGCTQNDECLADGGCGGSPIICPPPGECQTGGTCAGGACSYGTRTGACDGGTCAAGQCVPASAIFPYVPSNFPVSVFDGVTVNNADFNCAVTIDTSASDGGVAVTGQCISTPPVTKVIPQAGGPEAALLLVQDLNFSVSLTVIGSRPLIIAAKGNANLSGPITTAAGVDLNCADRSTMNGSSLSGWYAGGAGGAYGANSSGGAWVGLLPGGIAQTGSGNATITPLRGGCSGGLGGSATAGGAGGGALQISAAGDVNLSATTSLSAAGKGGTGGGRANNGNGGGGGGSGGAILLEGVHLNFSSGTVLAANGGGGGEAGDSSSTGKSGSDGPLGTGNASGGSGNASCGGNGGRGGSASNGSTGGGAPGGKKCGVTGGGGGGGGSIGRVRLNAFNVCNLNGATISPAQTSSGSGC